MDPSTADTEQSRVIRERHTLSFAELQAYVTERWGPDPDTEFVKQYQYSWTYQTDTRLARLIGVNRATVMRWREQGTLTHPQADRAAVGLDVNPTAIWGCAWHADIDPNAVPDDDPRLTVRHDSRHHSRHRHTRQSQSNHHQQQQESHD